MYLNIGADTLIKRKDIIGIFDLDTATVSSETKKLLKQKERLGLVTQAGCELPKSFVVTAEGRIYLSQFSASALKNRSEEI